MQTIKDSLYSINARQETDTTLIHRFIATDIFWDRFNTINEIIVGTGGSGKTAMFRMMEHKTLSKYADCNENARNIITNKNFVCIYMPVASYFGDLNILKHLDEKRRRTFFIYSFNNLICKSFIKGIESCINKYVNENKEIIEKQIVDILSESWMRNQSDVDSLFDLNKVLTADWLKMQNITREIVNYGNDDIEYDLFMNDMSFFSPIINVFENISPLINLTDDTSLMILIDEAHFLSDTLKIEINNLLRSCQRPFVFKIATEPYKYMNFSTSNADVRLRVNQDFQYISIDSIYKERGSKYFKEIINGILALENDDDNFKRVFRNDTGTSYVKDAIRILNLQNRDELDKIFLSSISEKRRRTAINERIRNAKKSDDKITHKYLPLFCTKKVWEKYMKGGYQNKSYFHGYRILVKISEENIRRFLRILNFLKYEKIKKNSMDESFQNESFILYADIEYSQTINMSGEESFNLLKIICEILKNRFHNKKYLENYSTSFKIDDTLLVKERKNLLSLIVDGRIIPASYTAESLEGSGPKWRISYLLAIMLGIHPRWGEAVLIKEDLISKLSKDYYQLRLDLNGKNKLL